MKKNIPNIITLFNLLLGWTSIYFAYENENSTENEEAVKSSVQKIYV